MVASENRGAGQEGSPLSHQQHGGLASSDRSWGNTSNLSSLKKSRWGMSTMIKLCREVGLQVSRLVAECYMAYFRYSPAICRLTYTSNGPVREAEPTHRC